MFRLTMTCLAYPGKMDFVDRLPIFVLRLFTLIPNTKGKKAMGKLQEKMKQDMILRGFAQNTMDGYLSRCRIFTKHFMRSQ